jgi:hypothetical protein
VIFLPSLPKEYTIFPFILLGLAVGESFALLFQLVLRANLIQSGMFVASLVGWAFGLGSISLHTIVLYMQLFETNSISILSLTTMLAAIFTSAGQIAIYLQEILMIHVFYEGEGIIAKFLHVCIAASFLSNVVLIIVSVLLFQPFVAGTAGFATWMDAPLYTVKRFN